MRMLAQLDIAAKKKGLCLRGALSLQGDPDWGSGTIALLGPDEPRFWEKFSTSEEFSDGLDNPLDRWSKRVIGQIADEFKGIRAEAVFPSDGPPYPPFLRWATESGQAWYSPVGLLVHADAGLLISYRGALILRDTLDLPPRGAKPCDACRAKPCLAACPVGALVAERNYDVASCAKYTRSADGLSCREAGCLVRRACPASERVARPAEQGAFHMSAFLRSRL